MNKLLIGCRKSAWPLPRKRNRLGAAVVLGALMSMATAVNSEGFFMEPRSAAIQIAELLQPAMEREGFVRKGLRWYRYESESTLVVEVQPAEFLPGPYINLGIYYLRYGTDQYPDIVDCQLDTGLVSVVPNPLRANALLDPNNTIPRDVRRQELEDLLYAHAIPWLQSMASFDAARLIIKQNPAAAHVAPRARGDMGLPSTNPGEPGT